jgi:hypothetical protein
MLNSIQPLALGSPMDVIKGVKNQESQPHTWPDGGRGGDFMVQLEGWAHTEDVAHSGGKGSA